jgi:hypothetical protein
MEGIMIKELSMAVGLLVLSTPAFGQTCRDRVEQLERELSSTRQQLYAAQDQLRRAQQQHYPNYRPYSSPYGYGYGQGPLAPLNQQLQQLDQLQRNLDNLRR